METIVFMFVAVIVVVLAVVFLKAFDEIAGRGPKQVKDGINLQRGNRVECPYCAELIMPQAIKCPYCRSNLHGA